jgi:hypothetical protein
VRRKREDGRWKQLPLSLMLYALYPGLEEGRGKREATAKTMQNAR